MPIPLLQPPLIDDESVIGYLQRMCLVGANGGFKPMVQDVVGHKLVVAPWLIPTRIEYMSSQLASMPSADDVLRNHTTYQALSAFIPQKERQRLLHNMLSDDENGQGMYFSLGLTHSLNNTRRQYQAFCLDCAANDEANWGVAAWRRSHQFPYVMSCGIHGAALRTGSGCCSRSVRASMFARLPLRICGCDDNTVSLRAEVERNERAVAADARIAALLVQALGWDWKWLTAEHLGQFYRFHVRQKGFAKGDYVAGPAFSKTIENWFSADLLDAYSLKCLPNTGWLSRVGQGGAPKSTVCNMLLIDFLFGSLEAFRDAFEADDWRAAPVKKRTAASAKKTLPPDEHLAKRDKMRAAMLDWIRQQEAPTRKAANRQVNTQVLWLRVHDAEWFLKALPPLDRAGYVLKSKIRWDAERLRRDHLAAEHVKQRYLGLTAEHLEPTKLSAKSLLEGLGSVLAPGPLSAALLKRLVDTPESFRGRRAVWILTKGPLSSNRTEAVQRAYDITRIGKSAIRDLAVSGEFDALTREALDSITDSVALKADAE